MAEANADETPAEETPAEEAPATTEEQPSEGAPATGSKTKTPSKTVPPSESARQIQQDPLNTEFLYYSTVLKILGPTFSNDSDRKVIIQWVQKLFRPEYHSSKLKEKRNRYLAFMTTSLLLDETIGPFKDAPSQGALADLITLKAVQVDAADWEIDDAWQNTLMGLPDDFQMLECCVHAKESECKSDHKLDKILDQEFKLFLYVARPYAYLLKNGMDRTRVAAWFQILCSIHGSESCSSMKAIRNDYMMALLGYLQDLRTAGPFAELPSWKTLSPLAEAAKAVVEENPITDPSGTEANEFLADQPVPNDGAFCYIALSGDLIATNLTV